MEDAIVMKLPKLTARVSRPNRLSIDISNVELHVLPSQVSMPAAIAGKLASDYAIDEVILGRPENVGGTEGQNSPPSADLHEKRSGHTPSGCRKSNTFSVNRVFLEAGHLASMVR
jgi:hypothetical protein